MSAPDVTAREWRDRSAAWIPLTNHTPTRETFYSGISDRDELEEKMQSVLLTECDGRSLRDDTLWTENGASMPMTVGWAVNMFEQYLEDKEGLSTVLQDMNSSDERQIRIQNSHRFESDYMRTQMGKFYALEREAINRWGSDKLTTVMITLSASPFKGDGSLMPPVDHLDSIMDPTKGSWRAVRTALGRALPEGVSIGDGAEYCRIVEPHTADKGNYASSGYGHVHVGLVLNSDDVEPDDFAGVLRSHVNNCPTARESAHKITDGADSSVSVTEYDPQQSGGLGAYLTAYMGKQLDEDPQDASPHMKRFMATLWASGRRRVSFSNGAQKMIQSDYENNKSEAQIRRERAKEMRQMWEFMDGEIPDWEMVGIETVDSETGEIEFIECDSGGGGYMGSVQFPVIHGQKRVSYTE